MAKFKPGDHAFILESNRIVREVTVVRCNAGMYLLRFNNSCNFIEESTSRIAESKFSACAAKGLAWKSCNKEVKFSKLCRIDFSCVTEIRLLFCVINRSVGFGCVLVYFAKADAFKPTGSFKT